MLSPALAFGLLALFSLSFANVVVVVWGAIQQQRGSRSSTLTHISNFTPFLDESYDFSVRHLVVLSF